MATTITFIAAQKQAARCAALVRVQQQMPGSFRSWPADSFLLTCQAAAASGR